VESFTIADIENYYKFPIHQDTFSNRWFSSFDGSTKEVLKSLWKEANNFRHKEDGIYKTKYLRRLYPMLTSMMSRL